jgi:hypothetical protein
MARSIKIENLGPSELVEVPLADGGGVTVLRGRNDLGKSEALKAVSALAGSGDKLTVRNDAAPGTKGKVSGCGVELTVFKSTRIKGVAEFEVLSGDFSIEDVVDPGVKDSVAADAKRIKALLRVGCAAIDPKDFYGLVGGQDNFMQAVGPAEETDPLVVSSRVRAWLHKQSGTLEKEADALSNKAAGVKHAYKGVDLEAEASSSDLQSRLEAAIREQSIFQTRREDYLLATDRWSDAKTQLAAAESEHNPAAVDEAAARIDNARMQLVNAEVLVVSIKEQLELAVKDVDRWRQAVTSSAEEHKQAERNALAIARLRKVVVDGTPTPVSEDDVAKAKLVVDQAREALEAGAKVRDARAQLESAAKMVVKSVALAKEAEDCRERAAKVNAVLNQAVEKLGVGLTVKNERLIIDRAGKQKLFDEISAGARRKVVLDIAIDKLGPTGLLPLCQEAWESLDGVARNEVYEHLRTRGVNMVTAACSTDERIVAEIYEP